MNQILLVSDQPMPNFLPVLNSELKPESVTLVVSCKMRARADWLKAEISKHQVDIMPDIDVADDVSDIGALQDKLMEWAAGNEGLFERSVLNVTGGTKPMAIAAQEVFRANGRPVFYVDITSDVVTWLDRGRAVVSLVNQPTLEQFLGLNGLSIKSGDFKSVVQDEKWRDFYRVVAKTPSKWALTVRRLNGIAFESVNDGTLKFHVDEEAMATPGWVEMHNLLRECNLVIGELGERERFSSSTARRFCNGVWLEHFVFEKLKSLGFDRKRAMMNVKIEDAKGNVNELDAIVLHENTCYVIEDKTKTMQRIGVADAAVYKLSQLSSRMGLRARGILVSALGIRPEDKDRARAYNVEVIDWLPDIDSRLSNIFRQ